MDDEDSFERYKMNLSNLPDYIYVQPPIKPLTCFMMYNFQKSCQEKKKKIDGHVNDDSIFNISQKIAISWNQLSKQEKKEYQKSYQDKLRKYNLLYEEYILLSNQKKILNAYSRFYRKLYGIYQTQFNYQPVEITKLIKKAWKKLPKQEKQNYQAQYQEQKQQLRLKLQNKKQKVQAYNVKLDKYKSELNKEKEKILQRYELNSDNLEKFREKMNFFKNQKNQKKKEKRRKLKEFIKEEEQKRVIENSNKLRQLKQLQIQQLKKEKELLRRIERSKKQSQIIKNNLKQSQQALAAILGSQKTFDTQKIQSDEESPVSHKTKKMRGQMFTPKKTAKKEKAII